MKSSLVFGVLALTATGCWAAPITKESGTPVPAARIYQPELIAPGPGRTASVTFLRDTGIVGSGCIHKIFLGGQAVFGMRAGEYHTLYLAPGQHAFALELEGTFCPKVSTSHSAVLAAGAEETYRIFLSLTGTPRVALVEPAARNAPLAATQVPFNWDSGYSAPGISLVLKEKSRRASQKGTVVEYELMASGFSVGEPSTLWWKRGASFARLPATIDQDGTVSVLGSKSLMLEGYVPGQPLDIALVSGASRAHAKAQPFPIEAKQGAYTASVELISETGLVFQIGFGGFQPGEKVQITSQYKDEQPSKTVEASSKGELALPVMFGPGDGGSASATAAGGSGVITIQYRVGKDALVLQ